MKTPLEILKKYWGYDSFKPLQEDIIYAAMDGDDTVALLPTGGGKSVCFQIPSILTDGTCLVVSPLIALMKDQVESLKSRGIKALSIAGGMSFNELQTILDNARFGQYKFLYLSPERLQQEVVRNAIKDLNINFIAVDEAHCISQWGNDFRPAYANISSVRELHPGVPIIALTASATPEVLEDTIVQLKMDAPRVMKASFLRENLAYQVFKVEDKLYRTEQLLKNLKGSAIVYVRNRRATVDYSNDLNRLGISASYFHGGMSIDEKTRALNDWKTGKVIAMVATNAFGMGIDHPNVRLVLHLQLPESIESYFQEAGRAGRDNKYARAITLYNEHDKELVVKQFIDSMPNLDELKFLYKQLNNYFQISYGEANIETQSFNFTEFSERYSLNTSKAYNGLATLDRLGVIRLSREFGRRCTVQFLVKSEAAIAYFEKDRELDLVGKTILRIYGGIFELAVPINLHLIQKKTSINPDNLVDALKRMESDGIISLKLFETDASITFEVPREDDKTLNPHAKTIVKQQQVKRKQVNSMIAYIENDKRCKSVQLLSYFGESDAVDCGICSVCAPEASGLNIKESEIIASQIVEILEEGELNSRHIVERLTFAESKVLKVLKMLLDTNRLTLGAANRYRLKA